MMGATCHDGCRDATRAVVHIVRSPNVLAVRPWDRLLRGALYAATARVDWATLLRRFFDVDVVASASGGGRLRVLGLVSRMHISRRVTAH